MPTGLRHLPVVVTPERVGHKVGEFAPTRKRLVPPSRGASRLFFSFLMGQKYHPLGLRLGLHRKWNTSWYSPTVTLPSSSTFVSGAVLRRGGIRQGGRDSLLQALIRRAPRPFFSNPLTSSSITSGLSQISTESAPRLLPVDLHIEVGSGGSLFFLFFYAKMREPGVAALSPFR